MIINEYVLMELNQQRHAQVADNIAALRAASDGHRPRLRVFGRRNRTVPGTRPAPTAIAVGAGSSAR